MLIASIILFASSKITTAFSITVVTQLYLGQGCMQIRFFLSLLLLLLLLSLLLLAFPVRLVGLGMGIRFISGAHSASYPRFGL